MKIKYKTNFKGYLPILRAIQLLLKNKTINFTQLGAYICLVSQADFDHRHSNFKVIIRDDQELAKEWSCSPTTVYRNRKHLIGVGLLDEEEGLTKVPNYFVFELEWVKVIAKLPPALIKSLFTESESSIAKRDFVIEELQKKKDQKPTQSSSISSKSDLSSSEGLRGSDANHQADIDSLLNKFDNESIGDEDEQK